MDRLAMLSQREQLMEDIDAIISDYFQGIDENELNEVTRTLCDAVCKNFPVWTWFCIQPILNTLISTIG